MGSSSSKDATAAGTAPSSSSSLSSSKRGKGSRSIGVRVFGSACLRLPQVFSDDKDEDTGESKKNVTSAIGTTSQEALDGLGDLKYSQSGSVPISNNNVRFSEDNQENASQESLDSNDSTSTQTTPIPSSSVRLRFRSHFGFLQDGFGFRLGRAASLRSSNTLPLFSRSFSTPYVEGSNLVHRVSNACSDNSCEPNPPSIMDTVSTMDTTRSNTDCDTLERSQRILGGTDNTGARRPQRRPQEHLEGTARFSRTLSVGRLRDRVLRRTSYPEGRLGLVTSEDRSSEYFRQASRRQFLDAIANLSYSNDGPDETRLYPSTNHPLNIPGTTENNQNHVSETPISRESDNHDTLEHRSTFLERRRRIRSQVRALQRLGSRFENLSGHDRSCILSGQHRTGRCACRTSSRATNSGDDTSTRASISRIVMLAEALFEVLDEIHQQAVVLASRPSLSSIGSVPAPKEVVDCMPVKMFMKSQRRQNDESAQCYICLVEYEEGDYVRILPCHHEFHQSCVDKWLKEIHRVCPLCRGDVCI